MKSKTRASLIKALSYCSLRELPEKDNGEDIWIRALALVTKTDGCEYFVDVVKDPITLLDRVKKDFGPTGAIIDVKAIYPYLYLSSEYMPKFSDRTKESRIAYLEKVFPNEVWEGKSMKEVNDAIIRCAINAQMQRGLHDANYIGIEEYEQDNIETEAG